MFKRVEPPSYESIIEQWQCGPVTIAVLAYAFAQYRVQVWYDERPNEDPTILSPDC